MIDMARIREVLAESEQRKVVSTQVNMGGSEISRSNPAGSHLAKFPSEQRRHSNMDIFISVQMHMMMFGLTSTRCTVVVNDPAGSTMQLGYLYPVLEVRSCMMWIPVCVVSPPPGSIPKMPFIRPPILVDNDDPLIPVMIILLATENPEFIVVIVYTRYQPCT